jgi:hypothetical protein
MKNNLYISIIIAVIVAGGLGFWGGDAYASAKAPAGYAARAGGAAGFTRGAGGTRGGGMASSTGGFVTGQIISADADTVTVNLQNGSSKIVLFSNSTQIMKSTTGTAADLTAGQYVSVTGTANSDGSVSASSIQVRPTPPANTGGTASTTPAQQ